MEQHHVIIDYSNQNVHLKSKQALHKDATKEIGGSKDGNQFCVLECTYIAIHQTE